MAPGLSVRIFVTDLWHWGLWWFAWADPKQAGDSYGLSLTSDYKSDKFDVVVLAVHHREFLEINMDELLNDNGFSFDITNVSLQPKSK